MNKNNKLIFVIYERRHLFTHKKFHVLNKRSGELVQNLWPAQAVLTGTANIVGTCM